MLIKPEIFYYLEPSPKKKDASFLHQIQHQEQKNACQHIED